MIKGKTIGITISSYITNNVTFSVLKRCINSLLETLNIIDKIIIIDDASTYSPVFQFYKKIKSKILTIIYNEKNTGIASVKNQSILLLKDMVDIIILSDNDNYFFKDWDFFYCDKFIKSKFHNINQSNVLGNDDIVKVLNVNDVEIGVYNKFQGSFIMIDNYIIENVGGFPLLEEKYGGEHFNFQQRVNKFLKRENYSYDFLNSSDYIKNLHVSNSFCDSKRKMEMSIKNCLESDKILEQNIIKIEILTK